mmetsp:Transcript_18042/g.57078  ORF Transcript_18042/g.57078 Transcript_18042/m.57078 type:complete len:203 (+) Transcript_18042:466-1074(+)
MCPSRLTNRDFPASSSSAHSRPEGVSRNDGHSGPDGYSRPDGSSRHQGYSRPEDRARDEGYSRPGGSSRHDYTRAPGDTVRISAAVEERIHEGIARRLSAKVAREFDRADAIREELRDLGVEIVDRDKLWRVARPSSLPSSSAPPEPRPPPRPAPSRRGRGGQHSPVPGQCRRRRGGRGQHVPLPIDQSRLPCFELFRPFSA